MPIIAAIGSTTYCGEAVVTQTSKPLSSSANIRSSISR